MKQYIMIIIIALHMTSSNIYAVDALVKQHNIHTDTNNCIMHKHAHEHQHFHNGSTHQHKHAHTQTNINFSDFYTFSHDAYLFSMSYKKEKCIETVSWIPNPTLDSLFRPPIV